MCIWHWHNFHNFGSVCPQNRIKMNNQDEIEVQTLALIFLSFWYRLILISAVQRMLFQKWSGFFRCFFWQSLIWPACTLWWTLCICSLKSSLDCRLWQWHVFLLESVLLLDVVKGFSYEEDPQIIHHCCLLWTSRPFYVAELTSVFFFSQNVPNCWFGHS